MTDTIAGSDDRALIDAHLLVHRKIIRIQNVNESLQPEAAPPAAEHEGFIDALERRDKARAVASMETHLKHVKDLLARRLNQLANGGDTMEAVNA